MHILFIEDETDILDLLRLHANSAGFEVLCAADGRTGLNLALNHRPDIIVLDLMLPQMDGLTVCRHLKNNPETCHIPVIMLTAKGEEVDRIVGFELGADDYVVKPFSPRELMLRIRSVLRRGNDEQREIRVWSSGGLRVDFDAHLFFVEDQEVSLTATEFRLLTEFISNQGRVVSRESLLDKVWGYQFEGYARTVDTHVLRLRKKLGPWASLLETVRGVGYRLNCGEEK